MTLLKSNFLCQPLEENIDKTLCDTNHSKILYDLPPRVMEIKAKISKWDVIKLRRFCTTKETVNKVKRQASEQEKIIANEASDKELISKIYKQLMQSNMRKINDPTEKLAILFGLFVFLVLSFVDRVPDELWNEVHDIVQETKIKTIPMEKKCKSKPQ